MSHVFTWTPAFRSSPRNCTNRTLIVPGAHPWRAAKLSARAVLQLPSLRYAWRSSSTLSSESSILFLFTLCELTSMPTHGASSSA